jgi:hypothetical protein
MKKVMVFFVAVLAAFVLAIGSGHIATADTQLLDDYETMNAVPMSFSRCEGRQRLTPNGAQAEVLLQLRNASNQPIGNAEIRVVWYRWQTNQFGDSAFRYAGASTGLTDNFGRMTGLFVEPNAPHPVYKAVVNDARKQGYLYDANGNSCDTVMFYFED